MVCNRYQMVLWSAVFLVAVGCGAAEKQETVPNAKREAAKDAEPQAEVATDPQPQEREIDAEPRVARRDDAVKQAAAEAPVNQPAPQRRTVFYRLDASGPAVMPKVLLSKSHEALCKLKVGDAMPAIELPVVGSNERKKLSDFFGKKATVVLFWKGDRRMAREALADLGPDVVELFGDTGVAVVGIAVNE